MERLGDDVVASGAPKATDVPRVEDLHRCGRDEGHAHVRHALDHLELAVRFERTVA